MKTVNSVNWKLLLDNDAGVARNILAWAKGSLTTREVVSRLAFTDFAGEFRSLVRNNGTMYARRLARKALTYRNINTGV